MPVGIAPRKLIKRRRRVSSAGVTARPQRHGRTCTLIPQTHCHEPVVALALPHRLILLPNFQPSVAGGVKQQMQHVKVIWT